jgi:hypothetical protein
MELTIDLHIDRFVLNIYSDYLLVTVDIYKIAR